jgi:hypothetical protein
MDGVKNNKAVWEARIAEQRASGKAQRKQCEEQGLSHNTFQGWVKCLGMQAGKRQGRKSVFIEAVPVSPAGGGEERGCAGNPQGIEVCAIKVVLPRGYEGNVIGALFAEVMGR